MLPKQGVLFLVALLAFFVCIFSPFYLPQDAAPGASAGLRKALWPVYGEYLRLEGRAAAGQLRGAKDPALAAARQHLAAANSYHPVFESETARHANNHLRAAFGAYADAVEDLADSEASGSLPVEGPDMRPGAAEHRASELSAMLLPQHSPTVSTRLTNLLFPAGWLLVLPCIFLVALGPMARNGLRTAAVRRRGVPMTGTVISVAPTGLMRNFQPQYLATVRLPSGDTTAVTVGSFGSVLEGAELPLIVLPKDHSKAVLAN